MARRGTDLLIRTSPPQNLNGAEAQLELALGVGRAGKWRTGRPLLRARAVAALCRVSGVARRHTADSADPTCPFCNARPVAGVLRGEGDGGKRWLLCSLCSTEWQYRRVLCPGCGEENKDKLPIYTAAEFPAARVDACDTCQTYLKSIDLTKDGHAIPMVDEIATVALEHLGRRARLREAGDQSPGHVNPLN